MARMVADAISGVVVRRDIVNLHSPNGWSPSCAFALPKGEADKERLLCVSLQSDVAGKTETETQVEPIPARRARTMVSVAI